MCRNWIELDWFLACKNDVRLEDDASKNKLLRHREDMFYFK